MRDRKKVARLRIHDMLDHIGHARAATSGLTLERFLQERMIQLATERSIEIISEASRNIPDEFKVDEPDIPWSKIAGIGNVLRHDYREIAPTAIWNAIQIDFVPLEAALRRMLARTEDQ